MASSFNTWKSVLLAQEMPAGADAAVARDFQRFLADNVCETDPTAAVVQSHARAIQQQIRDAEGLSMLAHHPEGKVVVIHHAVAQGGTTMQPDLRLGGLLGIDDVPTKFKSLVLLPPSILQNVLEEHEASPWAILSAIKRRLDEDAGSDDASDSGDDEGHGAAGLRSNEAVQHVVKWLWFVATSEQGDIPAVSLHPTTDPALKTCAREMHARCITGASGDGSTSRNAIGSTRRRRNDGSGGHGGVAHPRRMLEKHLGQPAELIPPSAVECSQTRRRRSAPVAPAAQGYPVPQNPACAVATTSATNPGSPVPLTPEQKAEALAVTFGRVLVPLTPAVMPAPTTASQALAPAPLTLAVRKPPTTSSTG